MWMRTRGATALAQALSHCRQGAGLTQEQLARRLRVNRTTLLDMEAGRNKALTRAAEALTLLGYDLVIVPRSAGVTVTEAPVAPLPEPCTGPSEP